jgi:putative transposase
MKDKEKSEEIATNRMQLIAPLLDKGLDAAKIMQLRKQICDQNGISDRTLRRYQAQYLKTGYNGLKPKGKQQHRLEEAIPEEVINQAVLLRREVPTRSVSQIIQILEWEGLVPEGTIKRSTLQEKLALKGYSTRHMKLYTTQGIATRRFQRKQRNDLWHSDIKYGPYLPIGPKGEKKQVYLVVFLDDATRYILHGEFYPSLDATIVEDCFRKAIMKYGIPDSVYFDNGKQYRNKWMARACAKIGTRLIFARPYGCEATGKVERFNRVVDSFLQEAYLEKPKTVEQLNKLFNVWVDECYQNRPHTGLQDNQSPTYMYKNDSKVAKFIDYDVLSNAFLHCESRKVDKAGCISFDGKKYEVGVQFTGYRVDVVYDPSHTELVTIEYENCPSFSAKELQIGESTGKKPKLPEHLTPKKADTSRLLQVACKKNTERKEQVAHAISYRSKSKGVVDHV